MTDTHPFNPALFRDDAISPDTAKLNEQMIRLLTGQPEWWVVGAESFRAARRRGEGPFPAPVMSGRARTIVIAGKDGNEIPLRVIAPAEPRGIYLHIHGGGWVLGGADMQDPMLERIADNTGQAVVSVEYRLAPEHPYPAGPDDCEAAAAWLLRHGTREFGTDVLTIGGEFRWRPFVRGHYFANARSLRIHGIRGANLVYGAFDMALSPQSASIRKYETGTEDNRHSAVCQCIPADGNGSAYPGYIAALRAATGFVSRAVQCRNEGRFAGRHVVHARPLGRGRQPGGTGDLSRRCAWVHIVSQ